MHKAIDLGNYSISQVAGYLHCFTPRRWNSEKKVGLGGYTWAPEKALHKRTLSSLKMKNSFFDSRNAKKECFWKPRKPNTHSTYRSDLPPNRSKLCGSCGLGGGSFPVGRQNVTERHCRWMAKAWSFESSQCFAPDPRWEARRVWGTW